MSTWFKHNRLFNCGQKLITGFLLCLLLFSDVVPLLLYGPLSYNKIEAAEAQIDDLASGAQAEHIQAGANTVFIDDQTGYKFYVESNGRCFYKKTTNGGASWGSQTQFDDDPNCTSPVVWYDRWTPGDTGNYIHITTLAIGTGAENINYNRLDTADNDALLMGSSPVNISSTTITTLSLGAGNKQAMTKGTDGTIYAAINDNGGSPVVECSADCQLEGSWSATGVSPMDLSNDFLLLQPMLGDNIMLIVRDVSAEDIEYQIWNNAIWGGAWNTIDANAFDNTTYDVGMSAVTHPETGDIYLAYVTDHQTLGTDDDIRTAKYTESSGLWTNTADVVTDDSKGLLSVALALDANTSDVYVAYAARTTPGTANSANVYWASSTAAMSSWSGEQGPVNSGSDNNYGLSLNHYSDERIHASWYDDASRDVLSDTIADITPVTVVTATGTQRATVRASTSATYIGGAFVIKENVTTRNVTSITITEQGTIDGATAIGNIALFYDISTTSPYNCSEDSYQGNEPQFDVTDTNGFSGANGIASFSDLVAISPTDTLCVYPVVEVLKSANDGDTIDITITNPATDVLVGGSVTAVPSSVISITGSTTVRDDVLTQTHYHWRQDTGSEALSPSATGGIEDTPISALQTEVPRRLRIGLSNDGSTTTFPTTFRLEYGVAAPTCNDVGTWIDVAEADDDWNMFDSSNLTNGADTTDVAVGLGGVSPENNFFLTPNGGVRDTESETGSMQVDFDEYTALEYSIVASTTATEGNTYCFRVSDQGQPIEQYDVLPQVTISADVRVRATGTQAVSADIPTDNLYIGGAFTITENVSSRDVTSVTLTEVGTVDGAAGVTDIRLYYDLDTTFPYNCASESFTGNELQYGATSTAFSSANGSTTFTATVGISTTSTLCLYPVLDITPDATDGETVDVILSSGSGDVVVSGGGSVAPTTPIDITGSTTLNGAIVTQTHYHWRNDSGSETGASSATGGIEDTPLTDFDLGAEIRLRVGVSNEGATTSIPKRYGLEYGIKLDECSDVTVWIDVADTADAWDMFDSSNLTNGETTTDISTTTGGVSDENAVFLGSNGGVVDTESFTATTTLRNNEYTDFEYSITSTADTLYDSTYCFRVTQNGVSLLAYNTYPEITMTPKRDFRIQRGQVVLTGTSTTLLAGVDYVAPSASTSAFVRITNAHHTGAGRNDLGGNQNARDYSSYIENPENLETSITFTRSQVNPIQNTFISWELVEFVGDPGTDNEMIVRDHGTINYSASELVATGTALGTVDTDGDVVVFITAQSHPGNTRAEGYAHQSTSEWNSATGEPVFRRSATGGNEGFVSYAVVEFTGINWKVQRVEHDYAGTTPGEPDLVPITPVNSLNRTFLHTQKRVDGNGLMTDFGHLVWVSSMGALSFQLEASAATTTVNHVSVAWVIENTQTSDGAMTVQREGSTFTGGADVQTRAIGILTELEATNNASIFAVTSHSQTVNNMPRGLASFYIASTTAYEIYRAESAGILSYWTEVVSWPVANISVRQNYYNFYVEDGQLDPQDQWPVGPSSVGENAPITALDEPLGEGERIRIRMSTRIGNANLPAGLLSVKLQYGVRTATCSAVGDWFDVGQFASSTIWRGYDVAALTDGVALSTEPPGIGDLNLSVSDVSGSYIEANPSVANPFDVQDGEDVEFDWVIEHNGANSSTFYCFRMVNSDGTPLDGYFNYPELRTAGFTPVGGDWRWYDDAENITPSLALAAENVAPTDIANSNTIVLRTVVDELKVVQGNNVKFKLQFSQSPNFLTASDVVASSTCQADSLWCYADGGANDNTVLASSTLGQADSCFGGVGNGCGSYNESGTLVAGLTHAAGAAAEYAFVLQHAGARANGVYYFRLYDVTNDAPLIASSTYPSLVTEGAQLVFGVAGLPSATTTEGVVTDVASTPDAINFGTLGLNMAIEAAHRLSVDTNATEGYQVFVFATQDLINSYGTAIDPIISTNEVPAGWSSACPVEATGCFGYHAGDDILSGASTRFSANDSFAALTTVPAEVLYNPTPIDEYHDVLYKIEVREGLPAGDYETDIVYLAVPVF